MYTERNADPTGREVVSMTFTVAEGSALDVDLHSGGEIVRGAAACAIGHCNDQANALLGPDQSRPRCGLVVRDADAEGLQEAYEVVCTREPDCLRGQLGEPDTLDVLEGMAAFRLKRLLKEQELLATWEPSE